MIQYIYINKQEGLIMNILKKLSAALFALVILSNSAIADSSNFAGPYVAIQASAAGIELDGQYNDPTEAKPLKDATPGMIGTFGSIQAGYNVPVSPEAFITIGGGFTPTGDASFDAKGLTGTAATAQKTTLTVSDLMEIFIEPSLMVSSNAAVFAHVGYSEGEIAVTGDRVVNQTLDLEGTNVSAGLKLLTDGGIFIKGEAGITSYDTINVKNITDTAGNATATAKADPTAAYGAITIGFKF
jgi:hypothetical protein